MILLINKAKIFQFDKFLIFNFLIFLLRVIECKGPTNTRVYTVAVYFQGKRLAKASGHSIQEAEMNSAKEALEKSQGNNYVYKIFFSLYFIKLFHCFRSISSIGSSKASNSKKYENAELAACKIKK